MKLTSTVITVSSAGTPVQVTTDDSIHVCNVMFATLVGGSGKILVGDSGLNASTLAGVFAELLPEASADPSRLLITDQGEAGNSLRLSDFYIDAQTSGQKCLVTYSVR